MTSKTALATSAAPRAMFHAPMGAHVMLRGPAVAYAPDEGPLSVQQAVAALREPAAAPEAAPTPEPTAAEEAPAGEPAAEPEAEPAPDPEPEAEPTAEEPLDPEAVIEEEEPAAEPESDPETPVIAAPQSWDAAERATFATLPPAAQEIILKRETERDRAVSKAQQEASQAKRTAEADLAGLAQYKETFDQIATRANEVFADKWSNIDWVAFAKADFQAYTIARAEYEADAGELQSVQTAQAEAAKVKQQAEQVEFQNYVLAEAAKLPEVAPELADPKAGAARRGQVREFLLSRNIPGAALDRISAEELAIAYDAMQFRALKASGKLAAARPAVPAPRPAAVQARAAAPSAAPPTRPTQQRNVETAKNRFAQTGSTDDAVALLRASRGA